MKPANTVSSASWGRTTYRAGRRRDIGAGFRAHGAASAHYAGPAFMFSFVLAAVGCVFAGLCYAESAAMIPLAGSCLHLWLRYPGRDICLDHRVGPDPGIRLRCRNRSLGMERINLSLLQGSASIYLPRLLEHRALNS